MSSRNSPKMEENIVIVGAGVFGLSTARALTKAGYKDMVLDRTAPPVMDGCLC